MSKHKIGEKLINVTRRYNDWYNLHTTVCLPETGFTGDQARGLTKNWEDVTCRRCLNNNKGI